MASEITKRPLVFVAMAAATVLVGTIVTMAYPMLRADMHPKLENLRPLGGGSYEHAREIQHRALLRQRAAVRQHAARRHLQPVVIQESERRQAPDQRVKPEPARFDELAAARVVEYEYSLITLGKKPVGKRLNHRQYPGF